LISEGHLYVEEKWAFTNTNGTKHCMAPGDDVGFEAGSLAFWPQHVQDIVKATGALALGQYMPGGSPVSVMAP